MGRRTDDQWAVWDKRIRDAVLFVVGTLGIVHEIWIAPDPRGFVLLFLGSLVGLPFVLQADERRREGGRD